MKLTSGLVLSALAVAASSPTVAAAPFPGGRDGAAPNNGGEASGTPQLLKSPDPEAALSPRARGLERFGGPSAGTAGQRRVSGRGKRDGRELAAAKAPSAPSYIPKADTCSSFAKLLQTTRRGSSLLWLALAFPRPNSPVLDWTQPSSLV